jgi:hypothetical protein
MRIDSLDRAGEAAPSGAELKGLIEAASQALIERDQHVVLRGAPADLLAHLARQITLELGDRQGEMATIHWLARLEDTLEVVNNLVATLPLAEAVAPARADTPTRVLVVRISRVLEADPWRLLGRLVSNFPGLRLRLLLIPEGAPEEALRELGPAVTRQLLAIPLRSPGTNAPHARSPVSLEAASGLRGHEPSPSSARPYGSAIDDSPLTDTPAASAAPAIVRSPRRQGPAVTPPPTVQANEGNARRSPRDDPSSAKAGGTPGARQPAPFEPRAGRGRGRRLGRLLVYLLLAALAVAVASFAYPQQASVLVDLLRQVPGAEQWLPQPDPEPPVPAAPLPNRPAVRVEPAAPASDNTAIDTTTRANSEALPVGIERPGSELPRGDALRIDAPRPDLPGADLRVTPAQDVTSPAAAPPIPPDPIRNDDRPSRKERRAR